jgi:hypothetical protein
MKALAMFFAGIPFAFGMIRALETGTDVRYIWVALAAMLGGILATSVARRLRQAPTTGGLVAAVFVASAINAGVAGRLLGTQMGPGLLIVAAGFAACFAAATLVATVAAKR